MMFDQLETFILTVSFIIIISVVLARWSNNTGFPYMLLFLVVGMLSGSEGFGWIHFDNYELARNIGVVALVVILFSGGFTTQWSKVKSSTKAALTLATLGVLSTAVVVGLFVYLVLGLPILHAFLLGSVVSSTDAAAVFSILGGKNLALKPRLKYLLELESGSNDPMAIFLTISFIELIMNPATDFWSLLLLFFLQMGLGMVAGILSGRWLIWLINKIRFPIEGFYPVMILAFVFFIYAATTLFSGSGFLAVYVMGIIVNNREIVYKRSIGRFFDGTAWLSQIVMFITLGLLVFPSQLVPIIPYGLMISIFLILIARPVGVYLSLIPFPYGNVDKIFISWVGLRGAVPIILGTFPLIAHVSEAETIFNIVFFIVITSAILQGWSIPWVSKKLQLIDKESDTTPFPLEFQERKTGNDMVLLDFTVPDKDNIRDKALVDLPQLKGSVVVLIVRKNKYIVPEGGTTLQVGDRVQVLCAQENRDQVRQVFSR